MFNFVTYKSVYTVLKEGSTPSKTKHDRFIYILIKTSRSISGITPLFPHATLDVKGTMRFLSAQRE